MTLPFESRNPANDDVFQTFESMGNQEMLDRLAGAAAYFETWRHLSFKSRSEKILAVAAQMEKHKKQLAKLITQEMGKPLKQARAEVEKCIWTCQHFAQNAENLLNSDEHVNDGQWSATVSYQPLGPLLGIMPWNFPLWQTMRFAIPSLMAGNVVLIKPAPNTAGSTLLLREMFIKADCDLHLFQVVLANHDMAAAMIRDDRIRGVSFTGSTYAGREIASQAGRALKKCVMELGGSDPYIVMDDADMDLAVKVCVESRLLNSGQSCVAAKRFIVVEKALPAFTRKLLTAVQSRKLGDPQHEDTDVGPMARGDLREKLQRQVTQSIERGAQCILGGSIPGGPGYFYPPTILTHVAPGMPAFDEELFGPVFAVIAAVDGDHALRLANQSHFGLGAAIFSKNRTRAEEVARDAIAAGNCFVNMLVRSDPRLPFGGIKESGFGSELGLSGIREFTYPKVVAVNAI